MRGYRATAQAEEVFADADRRIYTSMKPAHAADGWVLVSFSMPESDREKRHVLRSKLMWHGMGNVTSGLWIAQPRILDDVVATIKALGFAEYADVFRARSRAWAMSPSWCAGRGTSMPWRRRTATSSSSTGRCATQCWDGVGR